MKQRITAILISALLFGAAAASSEDQWENQKLEVTYWGTIGTRAYLDGRTLFAKGKIRPKNNSGKLNGLYAFVEVYNETGHVINKSSRTEIGNLDKEKEVNFRLPKCPVYERLKLTIHGKDGYEEFINEFHGFSASRKLYFEPSGIIKGQSFVKVMGKRVDYDQRNRIARVRAKLYNKGELAAEKVVLRVRFAKAFTGKKKTKVIKTAEHTVTETIESGKNVLVTFFIKKCPKYDGVDVGVAPETRESCVTETAQDPEPDGSDFVISMKPQPGNTYVEKCVISKKENGTHDITFTLKNDMNRTAADFTVTLTLFTGSRKKIKEIKISLEGSVKKGKKADITINRKDIPSFSGADVSLQYKFLK